MSTTRLPQPELLPAQPAAQADQQIVFVSIRELCGQPERFNINPEYQREDVWPRRQNQRLIDTILLGQSIGLLEGYKYHDQGKTCWEMMDGHQRINSIVRFYQGEYKTWTATTKRRVKLASQYGPVQPNRHFEQLDSYAKEYFLDYHLAIAKTPEMSALERAERFLDIQSGLPTTPAERLQVYPSKANEAAKRIAKEPFWEEFYDGEMIRKQVYLSSLYLLALQLSPDAITDLRSTPFLPGLASGAFDRDITEPLIATVREFLSDAMVLYAGMQFTDRAVSIAMYQSVFQLRKEGNHFHTSSYKGCLTDWLSSIIEASKRASGLPVYHRPMQHLLYAKGQRAFWASHRKTVLRLAGVSS